MHGWGQGCLGGGWFGGIAMIVFWVALIVGLALLVRSLLRQGEPAKPDPLAILKERYAKGEITTQEYEERRKTLTGG